MKLAKHTTFDIQKRLSCWHDIRHTTFKKSNVVLVRNSPFKSLKKKKKTKVVLARHLTFDIQKIKLQKIEPESAACITGSTWAYKPFSREWNKKNNNGVEHFFLFLREWTNGLKADFYPSLPRVLQGALGPTSPGSHFLYYSRVLA